MRITTIRTLSVLLLFQLHLYYPIENGGAPQKRVHQQGRGINQLFLSPSNQKLPPFSSPLVPDVHQLQRRWGGLLVIWINVTVFKQFPPVTPPNKPEAENWWEKLSPWLQSLPRRFVCVGEIGGNKDKCRWYCHLLPLCTKWSCPGKIKGNPSKFSLCGLCLVRMVIHFPESDAPTSSWYNARMMMAAF